MNIKEFKKTVFPDLERSFRNATGMDVTLDVDWDTLAGTKFDDDYAEGLKKVYFVPLIAACKNICRVKEGKRHLKAKLKKVIFCDKGHLRGRDAYTLADGLLTIDHQVGADVSAVDERIELLTELLQ